MKKGQGGITPEESRYWDGALGDEAARRLEARLDADPARRARLEAWRDAMDLWRSDAARRVATLDPAVLAERALAEADVVASEGPLLRRYATAAVVLIGLGVAGAGVLGPNPGRAALLETGAAIRVLEEARLAQEGRVEVEAQPFPAHHLEPQER